MKLIDRLKARNQDASIPWVSFEYFAPSTERGRHNLHTKIERMTGMNPLFVSLASSSTTLNAALALAGDVLKFSACDIVLAIELAGLKPEILVSALQKAKEVGIRSIMVQQSANAGDVEPESLSMTGAIRLIRKEFETFFTIATSLRVTAGPDANEVAKNLDSCIQAGANLSITEPFLCVEEFKSFLQLCRDLGVPRSFPIVPGILLIQNFSSFQAIASHLNIRVPPQVLSELEAIRHDEKQVQDYGIDLAETVCRGLFNSKVAQGVHFYTFNLEYSVRQLLEHRLEVTSNAPLPWRASANPKRLEEGVRPIFWANRPKSYLARTENWNEYPSGRWGSTPEPESFEALQDSALYPNDSFHDREDLKKKAWGEAPQCVEDICEVFAGYLQGKVPFLPWSEEALHLETSVMQKKLIDMNRAGFLTINSQPRVIAPSVDKKFGWGPPGGYVYQKAYVEFFTSPQLLRRLIALLETQEFSSHHQFEYHAVDVKGNTYSNSKRRRPCAVTWGVFPGKEIVQPTIVDPDMFMVWKDEAFALWTKSWASIYHDDSVSYNLLHDLHDTYFLVNVVDNNFVSGDIFVIFDRLMRTSIK